MRAHRGTNILFSAFELGILQKLSFKTVTIKDLALDLKISEDGLNRLLSALCAMGIAEKCDNKVNLSNEYSPYFNSDAPEYIGGLIEHEIHLQKRWLRLAESLQSGKPVKKKDDVSDPADTDRFIKAMASVGKRFAPILLEKIEFNGNEHILDLAGGPGEYLRAFCQKYPKIEATLFDLPETVQAAQTTLAKHDSFHRMHFIEGDLFDDTYGKSYDVIFISNVIHIFGDDEILTILNKCHQALNSSGRLLIKDYFFKDNGTGSPFTTMFSIQMLLSTEKGKCYREEEMFELMEQAKFRRGNVVALTESMVVIEGFKD
jgi:ubiquinone/menaquinone biosynthesis C-methylase UbiE